MRENKSPFLSSKEGNEICKWIRVCFYTACLMEKSEEIVYIRYVKGCFPSPFILQYEGAKNKLVTGSTS